MGDTSKTAAVYSYSHRRCILYLSLAPRCCWPGCCTCCRGQWRWTGRCRRSTARGTGTWNLYSCKWPTGQTMCRWLWPHTAPLLLCLPSAAWPCCFHSAGPLPRAQGHRGLEDTFSWVSFMTQVGLGTECSVPKVPNRTFSSTVYALQNLQEPVQESKISYYNYMLYQHFVCLQGK